MDFKNFLPGVRDFYKDTEILITGGTGFIGKVLVERYLTTCPSLKTIYLILRDPKNGLLQERIKEFADCDLFKGLKRDILNKIIIISGDSSLPGFGLSNVDRNRLLNVSIVVHCAASVRFNEPLRKAILLNVRGTKELCTVATQMQNLKAFVHVSTAYCNHRNGNLEDIKSRRIREELYPDVENDYEKIIKIAEHSTDADLNALSHIFTKFDVNTYLYAKALGETVCKQFQHKLPMVVYRPAIVTSYGSGPNWGWSANMNGPIGTSIIGITGINRIGYCSLDALMDMVPVDCCVNGIIIAAWKRFYLDKCTAVYNSTTDKVSTYALKEVGKRQYDNLNLEGTIWTLNFEATISYFYYRWQSLWKHFIPAVIIDQLLLLAGKKPRLTKIRRIITDAYLSLYYFAKDNFEIFNHNYLQLGRYISPEERAIFRLEDKKSRVELDQYCLNAVYSIQKNILKDKMDEVTTKKIRKRKMIINFTDKVMKLCIYSLLIYYLSGIFM